jgi:cell wall-associated NlpC family hydrolase
MRSAWLLLVAALLVGCASRPPGGDRALQQAIRVDALAQVGKPYRYGGRGPDSFDCSGLVAYVYGRAGIKLPRSTMDLYRSGEKIDRDEVRAGDLLFYRFEERKREPSHVVIYLGDGEAVHAPVTGGAVRATRIDAPWYEKRYVGARRVLE